MSRLSVSVIIPVFNEEEIIANAIRKNYHSLVELNCDFEIIIVDDGSMDSSALQVQSCIAMIANSRYYKKDKNEGLGAALRFGIQLSKKEKILCVPADSPLDIETLSAFVVNKDKADILVSYRIARLGYSYRMLINSKVFHFLISSLFDMQLKDYNWIHMYSRKIFTEGKIKIEFDGLFMLAEILIKAKRKRYSFFEFPVKQQQRLTGIASASKFINVYRTLRDIIKFRLNGHLLF